MVKPLSAILGRKMPSAGSLLVGILVGLLFATVSRVKLKKDVLADFCSSCDVEEVRCVTTLSEMLDQANV